MHNIAITGSFCAGKTHLLRYIEKLGYATFSCDEYIKLLYQDKLIVTRILQQITALKEFNVPKLAEIIYNDSVARKKLEAIIHPLVVKGIKEFEGQHGDEYLIFTEIPLVYEANLQKNFRHVICITCPRHIRLQRAQLRKRTADLFIKIERAQWPEEEKMILADFVLASDDSIESNFTKIIEQISSSTVNA
jgi:dephospho-CoA kinase